MKLCPRAWSIIVDGRIPLEYSTPPIVGECGKQQHDALLKIVKEWFKKQPRTLWCKKEPAIEYNVLVDREWRTLSLKPDLYILWKTRQGPVNIVVEVTTRHPRTVTEERLTAYALGFYAKNLRPTITLLVTLEETKILPLSTEKLHRLERLLNHPPRSKPDKWVCSNCDLRPVCDNPLA